MSDISEWVRASQWPVLSQRDSFPSQLALHKQTSRHLCTYYILFIVYLTLNNFKKIQNEVRWCSKGFEVWFLVFLIKVKIRGCGTAFSKEEEMKHVDKFLGIWGPESVFSNKYLKHIPMLTIYLSSNFPNNWRGYASSFFHL